MNGGGNKRKSNPAQRNKNNNERVKKDWGSRKFDIEAGMAGILAFCILGKERQCISELTKLLQEYAEIVYPELYPKQHADSDSEDPISIEDAFANEMKEMKKPKQQKLFYPMTMSMDCVVFIRTLPPIDPVHLVHRIFLDLAEKKRRKTRLTQRLIPISKTCHAGIDDITALTRELTKDVFPPDEKQKGAKSAETTERGESLPTWMFEFKCRWNDNITRDRLLQHIPALIPEKYKVHLGNPDIVLSYQIIKHICGISLLKDYIKFRKYNLDLLLEKGLDLEGKKKKTVEGGEEVKTEGSGESNRNKRSREEEKNGGSAGGENVEREGSDEKKARVEEEVVKEEV
ncbi:hypothetical protein HK097_001967 [Rhizophlyctis rosea]|uniref:THUMP domain-containing protein n=1 Tax=Rhizophlyctis rosea TaxID=64517 RepID=A0AAD5S634_9FUNG|nr:hypothetical protein HK097_001967 [Rhizophlyctis rosea]